jgi:lysophospholipase L1-like esterase
VHAPVSRVAAGTYERDEALEVDGKPFFFNGVQLRVDKNAAVFGPEYAYNSEKTRSLYKSASDLGFTTINVQVPWLSVQPDESVPASDAAYVVKGSPDETFSGGNIQTAFDSADEANQSLALLKFTIPSDYDYELTASKVRIYVDNEGNPQGDGADLFRSHDLKVYGLDDDWDDSDVTWDSLGVTDYDGQNLAIDGVDQTPLDVTPSWDRIKKANYYDLDVTDFVKAQYEGDGDRTVSVLLQSATPLDAESEVPISIDGLAGTYPPQLVLSSADERNFDWSYLDEAMRNASNNNLKFEIIWFGGDTTSNSMDNRIPYYVFQSVAKTLTTPSCASEPVFRADMTELKKAKLNACDRNHPAGAPLFKKRTAQTSQMYGVYDYLLDKADPKLLELETAALAKVMNHVAEWDASQNNGKHTTVGVQVSNESMTLSMEGSGSINGTSIGVSQSDIALEAWKDFDGFTTESTANNGADTFKEFNRHVLWNYYNELSKVVKESDYSVWTRANDARRGYSAVEYNQKVREAGGTSYLDFIGIDPYSASRADQYAFGHSQVWNGVDYSYGHNLPMIMEIGAEDGQYAVPYGLLSTLAGGGYYNIYELCGADEHGIFNSPAPGLGVGDCTYEGPFSDRSGNDTSAANRLKIDYLTGVNTMLQKIGHDVATKRPNGLSGTKLVYMNERQGAGSGRDVTAQLRSMDVTFRSHPLTIGTWSAETAGIAIERSATQFAFANAGAQATTFTLSDLAGEIASAQVGSYDDPSNDVTDNEWTKEADATVTTSGKDAVVTVPAFGVVRVITKGPVPQAAERLVEAESISDYTLDPGTVRQVWNDGASGGAWVKFGAAGMTQLPIGAKVTFRIQVPEAQRRTTIATRYRSGTDRAAVQLSVNGVPYSDPINMRAASGFAETSPADTVALRKGTNELTYEVTSPGVLGFDYVRLVNSLPGASAAVLINEDFGTAAAAPAFGFNRDATVSDGELKLNNNLGNETTAVKLFGPEVSGQSAVDVSFDWTYRGDRNSKGGMEFRDPYGRLVFAVMGATKSTGDNQLRYSTSGTDADSSNAKFVVEPTWTAQPITVGTTYTVRFQADFANKTISYRILDGTNVLVENANEPITATGLDRLVATSAYKENSNAQSVDNLLLTAAGDAPSPILAGRTVYAFGDSIVAGHRYTQASFIDFVARQEGMTLVKKAVNGATVLPSSNTIVDQLASAPAGQPDYIVFDGGTNDAYPATLDKLGAVSNGFDSELDVSTFAGAFENLIARMREKYPEADIVYTAVHRLGARDVETQEALREIELEACKKWGVTVADIYSTDLDTTDVTKRVTYSFDSLQASGLPGTADTTGSWEVDGVLRPTGTHPNFPAIEEFYAPVVASTLRDIRG